MAKKQQRKNSLRKVGLRAIVEERLKVDQRNDPDYSASREEILRIYHELAVHRIELEMQQDELQQSRSELEKNYGRHAGFYDFAPLGFLTLNRDSGILDVNLTASNMLGVPRSGLHGTLFKSYVLPEDHTVVDALLEKAFTDRVPVSGEVRLLAGISENAHAQSTLSRPTLRIDAAMHDADDGCRVILSDISGQKQSENELRRLARALRATNQCNQALIHSTDERELLDTICSILVETGGYLMAWVGYAEENAEKSIRPIAQKGSDIGYLRTMQFSWSDTERDQCPTGKAIRTGQPAISRNLPTGPVSALWLKEKMGPGHASALSLPLTDGNKVFGAITLYSTFLAPFDAEEIGLLTTLADNLSYGITMQRTLRASEHAEKELRESESRYRSLFQNKHTVMLIIDQHDGAIVDANPAATGFYGWTHEELCRMNIKQINQLTDEEVQTEMQRATTEKHNCFLFRHRLADGSVRDVEVHSGLISIENKALLYSLVNDITDRRQAEAKLLENHKRFTQALEAAHAGVWEWDVIRGEIIWSDEIWALLGLDRGTETPGMQLWQRTLHPLDRDRIIDYIDHTTQQGSPITMEFRVLHPDGTVHWMISQGLPLLCSEGNAVRYIGTLIDITSRKSLEAQLIESHERFIFMLEKSKLGGWDLDLQDKTAHRTLLHDRIFGYESLLPEWTYEMFLDHVIVEDRAEVDRKFHEAIENQSEWNFECRIRRTDGELRWIWAVGGFLHDHSGKPNRMSGIVTDITERKASEEEKENLQVQLQHAQKMQMLGQLAGGIAHDFNNMLTVILARTEIALERKVSSVEDLESIKIAANHSAELTRQLLAFARKQVFTAKVHDLNVVIDRFLPLLRRLIGENITLIWKPDIGSALVKMDASQIHQILVNICINSRDAIVEHGNITIETGDIHIDQAEVAAGHMCSKAGDYITLTVTDNGQGIDKLHLPHIFEPFFTTKAVGKGPGMGLSTVYGIIKQSDGFVDVESVRGVGTWVRIYLPRQGGNTIKESPENSIPAFSDGKQMILLVDDQSDILQICKQMLENKGYSVLTALSPREAIDLAMQYTGTITLLVTDVIMPDMSGSQLLKELQTIIPDLKALFMSGYTFDYIAHRFERIESVKFIEKPFSVNAFIKIVQEVITD